MSEAPTGVKEKIIAEERKEKKTMTLMEFATEIRDRIKNYLPDEYLDAETEIRKVKKNNGTILVGITVRRRDLNICPTVYLEEMYQRYEEGMPIEIILHRIVKAVVENDNQFSFDIRKIVYFDFCQDKIFPKLINSELNQEFMQDKPHREIADLSVIYQLKIKDNSIGTGNISITNDLMDKWGIDEETLHGIAIRNLEERGSSTLKCLNAMIQELLMDSDNTTLELDDDEMSGGLEMFILTNHERYCGASEILNAKQMKNVSQKFNSGYYALPSSIHEWIIVPKNSKFNVDPEQLKELVVSVNQSTLGNEDILSDHVYEYTDDGLQIAC